MTKQSLSLDEAVKFLQEQRARKRDYIVPVRELAMGIGNKLVWKDQARTLRPLGHEQLAAFVKIPMDYYRRCLEVHPGVLATQVNSWLGTKRDDQEDARMVRCIDDEVRAVLSSRYRRVDSLFVLSRALEGLKMTGLPFRIESMDATDQKMHMKAVFTDARLARELKPGDVVSAGVHIWDDEVGRGSWGVAPFSWVLACKNGATHNKSSHRGRHIGRNLDSENVQEFSQEAIDADDNALGLKIRDLVVRYGNEQFFENNIVGPMREALGDVLAKDASEARKVVEQLGKAQLFAQNEIDATLAEFLRSNDYSRYGLGNAVTFVAQQSETYERSCELEEVGGSLLVSN